MEAEVEFASDKRECWDLNECSEDWMRRSGGILGIFVREWWGRLQGPLRPSSGVSVRYKRECDIISRG